MTSELVSTSKLSSRSKRNTILFLPILAGVRPIANCLDDMARDSKMRVVTVANWFQRPQQRFSKLKSSTKPLSITGFRRIRGLSSAPPIPAGIRSFRWNEIKQKALLNYLFWCFPFWWNSGGFRNLHWNVPRNRQELVFSSPVKSSFFTSKRGNWQPQPVQTVTDIQGPQPDP